MCSAGTEFTLPTSLELFALFMATGVLSTLLLPETKGLTLEQLNGEEDTPEDEFMQHEQHSSSAGDVDHEKV